jgi:hypothetical protein
VQHKFFSFCSSFRFKLGRCRLQSNRVFLDLIAPITERKERIMDHSTTGYASTAGGGAMGMVFREKPTRRAANKNAKPGRKLAPARKSGRPGA